MKLMELSRTGSTTIKFVGGTEQGNYFLKEGSYKIGVPSRSQAVLGGNLGFDPAVEEFVIHIMSSSFLGCLNAYTELVAMFDLSEEFTDGRQTVPVLWRTQYDETASFVDQVIGRVGNAPCVGAPPQIIQYEDAFWILDIPISFMRKPFLVKETSVSTPTGAATAQGSAIQQCTFTASHDLPCPTTLYVTGISNTNPGSGYQNPGPGFIVVAPGGTIQTIEAQFMSADNSLAEFQSVVDSTVSVMRFRPVNTNVKAIWQSGSAPSAGKRMVTFWQIRNGTAGIDWMIRPFGTPQNSDVRFYGRWQQIDGSLITPQAISFGVISGPRALRTTGLEIQPSTTGQDLFIERVWRVPLDTAPVNIIGIGKAALQTAQVFNAYRIALEDRYLTDTEPSVQFQVVAAPAVACDPEQFSDSLVVTQHSTLDVAVIIPDRSFYHISTTRQNISVQATRYLSAYVPRA